MKLLHTITFLLALLLPPALLEAGHPKVVTMTPEDGQDDVDPALPTIRVKFDQPMSPNSWSIVGGGPTFPKIAGRPRWENDRTIVVTVELQPDYEYWMSVNSDTFKGFVKNTPTPRTAH